MTVIIIIIIIMIIIIIIIMLDIYQSLITRSQNLFIPLMFLLEMVRQVEFQIYVVNTWRRI